MRFEMPGRCPSGAFSPDGSHLAVASGFTMFNDDKAGEVTVFDIATGACLLRHQFEAYHVQVVYGGDGLYVADWQDEDDTLAYGVIARYSASGREVLVEGVGVNPFVGMRRGFAAVTDEQQLILGGAGGVQRGAAASPINALAGDRVSGRLATAGEELALLDERGQRIAAVTAPEELSGVAFLDPDRIVVLDKAGLHLWRHSAGTLTRVVSESMEFSGSRLYPIREHGIIVGTQRNLTFPGIARVTDEAIEYLPYAEQLRGTHAWISPDGALAAVTNPINGWLPPAPEKVDVYRTADLF